MHPRRLFVPLRCLRSCRPVDPRAVHRGRYREREHRPPGCCRRLHLRFPLQRPRNRRLRRPERLHGRRQTVAGGYAERSKRHYRDQERPLTRWTPTVFSASRRAITTLVSATFSESIRSTWAASRAPPPPNAARASSMQRLVCSASCASVIIDLPTCPCSPRRSRYDGLPRSLPGTSFASSRYHLPCRPLKPGLSDVSRVLLGHDERPPRAPFVVAALSPSQPPSSPHEARASSPPEAPFSRPLAPVHPCVSPWRRASASASDPITRRRPLGSGEVLGAAWVLLPIYLPPRQLSWRKQDLERVRGRGRCCH